MSYTYRLEPAAYALGLFHAAAHPSSTVAGLLVGGVEGNAVVIETAYPLTHRYATLSLTAEVGIDLVTARIGDGKKIVGVYVAREEGGLGRVGENLLKAVQRNFPGAVGLALDNAMLTTSQAAFTSTTTIFYPDPLVCAAVLKLIREKGVHASVKDLDDHLDDASVDWMENKEARGALAALP